MEGINNLDLDFVKNALPFNSQGSSEGKSSLIGIPLSFPLKIMIYERKDVNVTSQGTFQAEELTAARILTKYIASVLECIDIACSAFRYSVTILENPFQSDFISQFL